MSNGMNNGGSLNQKVRKLQTDMIQVTETFQRFAQAVSQQLGELGHLRQQAQAQELVLEALVDVCGRPAVEARVDELQRELGEKDVVSRLEAGRLKAAEVTGEDSFLVGVLLSPDGAVVRPGRIQLGVRNFREEIRPKFLGKKAGDQVEDPSGTFVINEVYDLVEPLPPEENSAEGEITEPDAAQTLEAALADLPPGATVEASPETPADGQ